VAVLLDTKQAQIVASNQGLGGSSSTAVRQVEMRQLGIGPTGAIGLLIPVGTGAMQLEARINQLDNGSQVIGLLGGSQTITFLLGYNLSH
jgi:hypothetical protein